MIRIRLSDEDRARLGCPEWLMYDPMKLRAREAAMLAKTTGYDPIRLGEGIQGKPLLDGAGKPVLDEAGEQVRTRDWDAWLALVWLCCVKAGCAVPFNDFDFELGSVSLETDAEDTPAGEEDALGTPEGVNNRSDSTS